MNIKKWPSSLIRNDKALAAILTRFIQKWDNSYVKGYNQIYVYKEKLAQ